MVHVRVLVPVTSTVRKPEDLAALAKEGITLSSAFIAEGPPSIESRFDEVFCVPGLIALALEAERDGVDALVIDCMGDPGLAPVREAVAIPVLGVAQTAMAVAALFAQRFGVVTVLDRTTTMINELVDIYGHRDHYVGCRPVGIPVLQIHDDMARLQAELAQAALWLVEQKEAAAIIMGCTGFLGCAEAIRMHLASAGYRIPVIDPVPTAIASAAALAGLGLAQSQISYPRFDQGKPILGFEHIFSTR
ncbi:MAG: aspartate/glutamate racemase family protein [Sphingomonadaceae bacterium]